MSLTNDLKAHVEALTPEQADEYHRQSERYKAALHAMQTGVAYTMDKISPGQCTPKHLRVGINSAMSDHAALIALLVKKGIVTLVEYQTALADFMEQEVATYQRLLEEHYGCPVTLA